jgi:mono/diheme cytochrome c family protein
VKLRQTLSLLLLVAGLGTARAGDQSLIAKGTYLARAGDCIACHTNPGDALFAGGFAMPTPFGTLYSSNITPDRETGIGSWTADQFYGAMHTGRFPDGGLMYPAMPFGSYTKVTRADSDAIFAYLRSVSPVHQPNKPHDLRPNRPHGTVAPILWKASVIAGCATRQSTRSAAIRHHRRSKEG